LKPSQSLKKIPRTLRKKRIKLIAVKSQGISNRSSKLTKRRNLSQNPQNPSRKKPHRVELPALPLRTTSSIMLKARKQQRSSSENNKNLRKLPYRSRRRFYSMCRNYWVTSWTQCANSSKIVRTRFRVNSRQRRRRKSLNRIVSQMNRLN